MSAIITRDDLRRFRGIGLRRYRRQPNGYRPKAWSCGFTHRTKNEIDFVLHNGGGLGVYLNAVSPVSARLSHDYETVHEALADLDRLRLLMGLLIGKAVQS
ncbi:MAG: hypothetical protein GY926_19420 [bacterium]|nr:hypothetical protein [bacterium]